MCEVLYKNTVYKYEKMQNVKVVSAWSQFILEPLKLNISKLSECRLNLLILSSGI